jgi:hypothetical protein
MARLKTLAHQSSLESTLPRAFAKASGLAFHRDQTLAPPSFSWWMTSPEAERFARMRHINLSQHLKTAAQKARATDERSKTGFSVPQTGRFSTCQLQHGNPLLNQPLASFVNPFHNTFLTRHPMAARKKSRRSGTG